MCVCVCACVCVCVCVCVYVCVTHPAPLIVCSLVREEVSHTHTSPESQPDTRTPPLASSADTGLSWATTRSPTLMGDARELTTMMPPADVPGMGAESGVE